MTEYIRKDKIFAHICHCLGIRPEMRFLKMQEKAIYDYVMEMPDDIVRCKDCKHYVSADSRAFGLPCKKCEVTGFEDVDDEDYCSRAERKENEIDRC